MLVLFDDGAGPGRLVDGTGLELHFVPVERSPKVWNGHIPRPQALLSDICMMAHGGKERGELHPSRPTGLLAVFEPWNYKKY